MSNRRRCCYCAVLPNCKTKERELFEDCVSLIDNTVPAVSIRAGFTIPLQYTTRSARTK